MIREKKIKQQASVEKSGVIDNWLQKAVPPTADALMGVLVPEKETDKHPISIDSKDLTATGHLQGKSREVEESLDKPTVRSALIPPIPVKQVRHHVANNGLHH